MNYPKELTSTYEIYEQIGAGGGGTVYRAMHKRLQKIVVLKKLKGSATSIMDCRTEVDILKNLRHSYLPQVLDFIESPEGIFTVMDFIPGKSLQKMLDEKHSFTEKEVLKYTKQLCEALEYLHSQNPPIVHGDIKPDNIMITTEGNVCLIDFNISGILEGTGATTFGYTPGFSAPEQAEAFEQIRQERQQRKTIAKSVVQNAQTLSEKTVLLSEDDKTELLSEDVSVDKTEVLVSEEERTALLEVAAASEKQSQASKGICIDKRSDIYSLGATVYTLLTGKLRNPKDTSLILSEVSSGFSVVLAKALEYAPEKRYQDAGSMLQAVLSVHKNDKKYRRLLHFQEFAFVLIFLVISASIFSIAQGMQRMEKEKEIYYEELVENLYRYQEEELEEDEFEAVYEEAIALFPNYLDAYYTKAYYLYQSEGIEETVEYMNEVMSIPVVEDLELQSNLYYLYGECCFQMERYEEAEFYYDRAITYWPSNVGIYRDYAISLAYLERQEEAEKVLSTAISMGLGQADVFMVQGELQRLLGQNETAIELFSKVLKETKDSYMQQRAYIMASKTFEAIGTKEALLEDITWLTKAVKELDFSNRLLIYERLVQDYIRVGEMTKENSYYENAITVLEEIIAMNWDNYLTYSNSIVLSQRIGNLEEAVQWGEKMLQKYPEHYVTYIRLCHLEIEQQNQKANVDRSYQEFAKYYEKAKECYEKQVAGNVTNAEMLQLEQTYQQIKEGGWLE